MARLFRQQRATAASGVAAAGHVMPMASSGPSTASSCIALLPVKPPYSAPASPSHAAPTQVPTRSTASLRVSATCLDVQHGPLAQQHRATRPAGVCWGSLGAAPLAAAAPLPSMLLGISQTMHPMPHLRRTTFTTSLAA